MAPMAGRFARGSTTVPLVPAPRLVLRVTVVAALSCAGCAAARAPVVAEPVADDGRVFVPAAPLPPASAVPGGAADEVGLATWYGERFAGKRTASGERFDPTAMTAAHRRLPFGTWVSVRRPDTGATVRVRINDRGPWGDARKVIDLSRAAADLLGVTRAGVAPVELHVLGPAGTTPSPP